VITARIVASNVLPSEYFRQPAMLDAGRPPVRGEAGYVMSRSDLGEFANCPHRWRVGYRDGGSESTEWGSMVDAALFGQFGHLYATLPETYEDEKGNVKPWNGNSTVCKQTKADIERNGQIPVKRHEVESVNAAVEILRNDYDASCLLENARTQVHILGMYKDEETGLSVPLRALLDIVPDAEGRFGKCLADLKTCSDASPEAWPRTVAKWGWHIQAAFYLDLYRAATGEDRTDWLHLVQESQPPYEIGRRVISSPFVDVGRAAYREALVRYAWCLKNNEWPGYDEVKAGIMPGWTLIEPDAWMVTSGMERALKLQARVPTAREAISV